MNKAVLSAVSGVEKNPESQKPDDLNVLTDRTSNSVIEYKKNGGESIGMI